MAEAMTNVFIGCWLWIGVAACSAQEPAAVVKVTVDGLAYMGDTDTIQAAKERAMKDAERKAVEQGTGLYIESYSKVHNYMTVEDEIKSLAAGYIVSKKVLIDALESDPPRYHVQIEADVKCGDLSQLSAAAQEEQKTKALPASYVYQMAFETKTADGSWQAKQVRNGEVVRVGDRLQLEMQPANPCHLIIVLENGRGRIERLFPAPGQMENRVQAGQSVRAPVDPPWRVFDEQDIGNTTVYLFAAQHNPMQLNWLLEKAEQGGSETDIQAFKKFVQGLQKRQTALRRTTPLHRGERRNLRSGEKVTGAGILVKAFRVEVQP
ncbi:MAG TPA: DUF4384 domain-containing protein [bacterium]|nr:DUF4384 domain-containing protein [bacterium]HPN34378.1 DUF4384 domain-containing protein [bacterium]